MEYRFNDGTTFTLKEGVDPNKFGALRAVATIPGEVKSVFLKHNYDLNDISGEALKIFCVGKDELEKDIKVSLDKIDVMGLKNLFNTNLKMQYFRSGFLSKLEECINKGVPYLNSDNSFASFFNDEEAYVERMSSIPSKQVESAQNMNSQEMADMDSEDRQVYNDVVQRLNFLILGNPTDEKLITAVHNAIERIPETISRKEYKFIGSEEMALSVAFDGLDFNQNDIYRITELIKGAFPEENMGRKAA